MSGFRHLLLGLGSNLNDPPARLAEAVDCLNGLVTALRVSSVYRTEPVGFRDQPDFYNLACLGRATLPPLELLRALLAVESGMGRRRERRDGPRVIDIDLLAYGDISCDTAELVLPHPRLHQRAFVLVPLAEIVPDWTHPVTDLTPAAMLAALDAAERVERWGSLPAF